MTILDTMQKQPGEVLDYDISYKASDLPDADTLNSATASWVNIADATDITSLNLGLCQFFNAPARTKTWIGEGLTGKTYKITVVATSTGGRTFEDEFLLKVKED